MPSRSAAIYPGSFDPPTNGHLDLIARGARLFDHLIVAILKNTGKQPLFSIEERAEMLREAVAPWPNVEIDSFDGLLVDYAAHRQTDVILRGIRNASDYESEAQMALLNRRMRPQIEVVLLAATEQNSFVSSRMVKEIIVLGGDVSAFVPESVSRRLKQKT